VILDSLFRLEGDFSASAIEIKGSFPLVRNSMFYSIGTAGISEVFSSSESSDPAAFGVTGNLFSGFTHILGRAWPAEQLALFNQSFASPDRPNLFEKNP
jgi:hypothetical protein